MFGNDTAGIDLLRLRSQSTPQRVAISDSEDGSEWSYRELDEAVSEMARSVRVALEQNAEQTCLAVALSTRPEFVFAAHATMRLGWQLVPLNTRLSQRELKTRITRLDPAGVVCGAETESTVIEALSATESGIDNETPPVLTVDEPVTEQSRVLRSVGKNQQTSFDPHASSDTALILFTSGTTGDPKAVRLTVGNLVSSAIASALRLGVTPQDRWLCCLPMYHMGGLAPVFRSALYGTTLVLQRQFDATETAKITSHEGITGISLVPTQLSRLLDEDFFAPSLRTVLLGGAPAAESLLDRADDSELPVYPTYGLTETASQVATARPAERRDRPGTVGQPLFGTTVRIVDEGETLDAGERGEIVVDGPTVTPGYLDEVHNQGAFSEFGLHTGDVGYFDTDGYLWVLGRLDDTIITGGELVAPAEVAAQLQKLSTIEDTAVVGIEDEEWGERVGAVIVKASADLDTATVREQVTEHCRETLADYKRPRTIRFVETIPRTHSGTVDRERTRTLLKHDTDS